MYAKLRDTVIYFDVEGAGLLVAGDRMVEKPVAFLIHGGPGADHTSYKPTFSPLSEPLQLVYFDHRGQGRSQRGNPGTYTLDNNVEDMEALRQHLGLDQIIAIGGSYGGMVAMSYAIRYPQHVSHLIVFATAPDSRFLQRAQEILAERGTPEQQAIAERLWQGNFETPEQLREYFQVMGPLYSLTYDPELGAQAWGRAIVSPEAINTAFRGFLRTYDLRDQLPQITCPTLVIGAEQDWICAPEFSVEIAQAIPNSQLEMIAQSGHSIRADQPEQLLNVICRFLLSK